MLSVFSSKYNCARIWIYICQFIYIRAHIHALKYFEDHIGYVRRSYHLYCFETRSLCPRWLHPMCNCTPEAPVLTLKCWDPGAPPDLSPF